MTDLFFQGQCEKSRTTSGPGMVLIVHWECQFSSLFCKLVYALKACLPVRSVNCAGLPVDGRIAYLQHLTSGMKTLPIAHIFSHEITKTARTQRKNKKGGGGGDFKAQCVTVHWDLLTCNSIKIPVAFFLKDHSFVNNDFLF